MAKKHAGISSIDLRDASSSESALIDRFQKGEKEVFNELVIRYQGRIYNLVYKYVPTPNPRTISARIYL